METYPTPKNKRTRLTIEDFEDNPSDLPPQILLRLYNDEILGGDFGPTDIMVINVVSHLWRDLEFFRTKLSTMRRGKRVKLVEDVKFTKTERYILNTLRNASVAKVRVPTEKIVARVKRYYKAKISNKDVERLRQVLRDQKRGKKLDRTSVDCDCF